jgi:tetratricopeptide (TPR) repeat protein
MIVPRLVLAFCLLVITARVASADDPALRAAKLHFERGEKLYALTRFTEALDEYQLAFDAKPIADFLFNIGQCYRNLADYDSAIFSYKKYLKLAPDAPNRARVEQLITELEAKQDHGETRRLGLERKRAPEPAPVAAAPAARPIYKTWWFWTGLGVVAAAGGGVAAYELTRTSGPPDTSLGNIVFGK